MVFKLNFDVTYVKLCLHLGWWLRNLQQKPCRTTAHNSGWLGWKNANTFMTHIDVASIAGIFDLFKVRSSDAQKVWHRVRMYAHTYILLWIHACIMRNAFAAQNIKIQKRKRKRHIAVAVWTVNTCELLSLQLLLLHVWLFICCQQVSVECKARATKSHFKRRI